MENNEGNAEIMGVVLLISVFVAAIGLVGVTMLSAPQPEKVPAVAFDFWTNDTNTSISLIHRGGETLNLSGAQLKIIYSDGNSTENPAVSIDWGQPQNWSAISTSYLFHIGDSITFNATKSIDQVQLIWPGTGAASMTGGGGAVLLGAWSPNGSSGRVVPAAITGAVPISSRNPEQTIPTMTPNPGWDLPDIFFYGNPTAVASGSDVQFNVTTLYGPHAATSYNWSFGYGYNQTNVIPRNANATHNYNTTQGSDHTVYTVTLTGSLNDGRNRSFTRENYITVYNLPEAKIAATPSEGYAPLTVNFIDGSTGYVTGWTWNFGDGTDSVFTQNASHTFPNAGTYNVTLTVSNPYTSSTATIPVSTPTPAGGMINGTVYNDQNGDRLANTTDPKLAGWTINLIYDGKVVATTTSDDANGAYAFYGLQTGKFYSVAVVLPIGWQGTNPGSGSYTNLHITGETDKFLNIDFWNYYKPVITGGTIILGTSKPGYIVSGSSLQFRSTNSSGSGNNITFADYNFTHVNADDIVKIVIWTSGTGRIQTDSGLSGFWNIDIADASLYINGIFIHRGHLNGITIPDFDNVQSALTLTIPSHSAQVDFKINGNQVSEIPAEGADNRVINLYNVSVGNDGAMNISYNGTPTSSTGSIGVWSNFSSGGTTVSGYQVLP